MVKWPFRRSEETSTEQPEYQVPPEIQDYYQAERRERTGLAWIMATATLVVTIILAIGLFFGGRWIYRKVVGNDSQPTVSNSNVEQTTTDNQPESQQTSSASTSQPSPSPTPPASTPSASTPAPTPSPSTATPPAASSPNTLAANSQSSLPNTGPGDVAAAAVIATVLGTATHYAVTSRRFSRSRR